MSPWCGLWHRRGVSTPHHLHLPARRHTSAGREGEDGDGYENLIQVLYMWKALLKIWVGLGGRRFRARFEKLDQNCVYKSHSFFFSGLILLKVGRQRGLQCSWSQSMLLVIWLYTYSHSASSIFSPLLIPVCVKTSHSKAQIKTLYRGVDHIVGKLDIQKPLYTIIFLCEAYICHNLFWNGDRSWAHLLEVRETMLR